jgi:hypothetical protein
MLYKNVQTSNMYKESKNAHKLNKIDSYVLDAGAT